LLIVLSALLLVAIGVFLVNRRASLEVGLRVKNEFLTTMSHELRTPLTGVIGITDLLQAGAIPHAQRDLVRMLRTNATTLLALVNNVLDYSRIDAGLMACSPRRFPIHGARRRSARLVSEAGGAQGACPRLRDRGAGARPDRRRRPRAAGAAEPPVERREVHRARGDCHSRTARRSTRMHCAVAIAVRDTGIGIREDLQTPALPVVQPVERPARQRAGGTGLGLAISDRLSRLLGGSIMRREPRRKRIDVSRSCSARTAAPPGRGRPGRALTAARLVMRSGHRRDQLFSLLRGWKVEVVARTTRHPDLPAMSMRSWSTAEASAARSAAALLRNRPAWKVGHVPVHDDCASMRSSGGLAHSPLARACPPPPFAAGAARCASLGDRSRGSRGDGAAAPQRCLPPLSVLVVEDNEPNRRVIRLMLNELGLDLRRSIRRARRDRRGRAPHV
jgi:hypothetical protein